MFFNLNLLHWSVFDLYKCFLTFQFKTHQNKPYLWIDNKCIKLIKTIMQLFKADQPEETQHVMQFHVWKYKTNALIV